MGRTPCCDKTSVKKGAWSPEEDEKLREYLQKNGTGGNWVALPHKAGLKRCGKSCRLRWLNYLRPDIKHGKFSDEEDRLICSLFSNIGSRWSVIAAQLPGRTDNDVKNHWNTNLKKKMVNKVSPILQPPASNSSYRGGEHGGRDGVLMFGSEGSSGSSNGGRTSWEEMGQMSSVSNGGESPLEHGFEEIKELISSSSFSLSGNERILYYPS